MPNLTQKGQVTIPLDIRKKLNLKTGDEILFKVENGKILLQKKTPGREAFQKFIGFLGHLKGQDPDMIIDELRGKPDDFSD